MVILKIIILDLMMRIAGPDHMPVRVYASGGQDVNHKCGEISKQIKVNKQLTYQTTQGRGLRWREGGHRGRGLRPRRL